MEARSKFSYKETVRPLILMVIGALLLFHDLDGANAVWLYAIGVGILLAGGSHITRRVMFNKLDLQSIALKASEHPIGAAVVFMCICFVIVSLIWIPVAVVR